MYRKNIGRNICVLGFLLFNVVIISFPLQETGFLESDHPFAEILRGQGLNYKKKSTPIDVPKLTKDSIQDFGTSINIRNRRSSYYVPGWADTRWFFRKNVTIDATKVSDDLNNFPVLIDLYDSDLQQDAQASGNDIFFTNSTAHILDHEVELYERVYNSTHAHLVTWVKANLSSSQDTILSMYYGNPNSIIQENPQGVWDANYVGVWHLSESSGSTKDSTSEGLDGTPQGGVTQGVGGQIANGYDFDGSNDYIDLGTTNSLYGISPYVTVSAWIYPSSATQLDDARVIETPHYTLYNVDTGTDLRFLAETDSTYAYSRTTYVKEEWTYFVGVFNGSETKIYKNGILADSDSLVGSLSTSSGQSYIGGRPTEKWWSGEIDEVRISSTVRSAGWVSTEFNNQDDPVSFYSVGKKECSSNYWAFNTYKYRKQITIDSSKVSADLTNFPVLLDLYDTDLNDPMKVQADGDDLLFTTTSGEKLDYEIELFERDFNDTYAKLVAWVRIPTLSATTDTVIKMYYGNPLIENQENPSRVWNSNYKAVYHLDDEPTGSIYDVLDSTPNKNHGIANDTDTANSLVDTQIGQGLIIDGSYHITADHSPSGPWSAAPTRSVRRPRWPWRDVSYP